MPDLDQLLDTFAADVQAGTRAPGASAAINRARQRRRKVTFAAAAVVMVLAGGGVVAAGTLGASDRSSPIGEPTPATPESPRPQETTTASLGSIEFFTTEVRRILVDVPDWEVTDDDPLFLGPCEGSWSGQAGGSGGSFDITGEGESSPSVWHNYVFFRSSAEASRGVAQLVDNLSSCTVATWSARPIAQTGGILASSDDGVAWIHHKGPAVSMLQVPTTDGPPPTSVQVEVADLLRSSIG
jgi:hypothetical protein